MSQAAQKAEAANAPVTATWHDREWTTAPGAEWSWDILEAIDDEKYSKALRALLSEEDYEAFKALRPTITDGGALMEALVKAAGFADSGE